MDGFTTFLQTQPIPDDITLFFKDVLPGLALILSLSGYNRQLLNLLRHDDSSIRKISLTTLLRLSRGPASIKRSLISDGILDQIWLLPLPDEETLHIVSNIILALTRALVYPQIFLSLVRMLHHRDMSSREATKETLHRVLDYNPESFWLEFIHFFQRNRVRSDVMEAVTALLHPALGQPSASSLAAVQWILSHHDEPSIRSSGQEALLEALQDDKSLSIVIFETTFFTYLSQLCTPHAPDRDIEFITRSLSILGIYFDQQLSSFQIDLICKLTKYIASRRARAPRSSWNVSVYH
jgi:hypothetical protein